MQYFPFYIKKTESEISFNIIDKIKKALITMYCDRRLFSGNQSGRYPYLFRISK